MPRRSPHRHAVSPVSRRIFLYWLLLMVPALFVGGTALVLLRREQARLAEQESYAAEARRAAAAARARLTVENIELALGDAQTGLLDAIAAQPADGLAAFLERWEGGNPLVRTVFLASPEGRLLRPAADAADEDARGFVRRFGRILSAEPPWRAAPPAVAPELDARERVGKVMVDEGAARQGISSNVLQAQSARRDIQDLLKTSEATYASNAPLPTARSAAPSAERREQAEAKRFAAESTVASKPASAAKDERVADVRGWRPWRIDGRLHLLGWVQPGGTGPFRGVELELAAFIGRLGGALPADVLTGEGFALRDDRGRVLHQAGAVPGTGEPALRVPLAEALLPGWEVVAYLAIAPERSGARGVLGVAGLLLAVFVAAILAGGSLLLWQARRSEAEAAQKTSFVANVSHEFKTPLTTIRLYAELLEQGRVRDAAQGGEYLRTIGRETQRLARLVNNALDFSRLEQGQKKFAREALDLRAELGRMLDTHAPRVAEAGLTLVRALPAEPLGVTADRDALEQIVLNLIDNACKYAATGGEVHVAAAARADGGAEVCVADRGAGVPADHRERIFEKFHRVDDALTAEKSGAGLGLSIARQLARGLGGDLVCTPRSGGGAEFILSLPPS